MPRPAQLGALVLILSATLFAVVGEAVEVMSDPDHRAPRGAHEPPQTTQAQASPAAPEAAETIAARAALVDLLAQTGIRDGRVLDAMRRVPRHLFVPEGRRFHAYETRPLLIGEQQTISQPFIVAYMSELMELDGTERVLEVGTGSGYQAAVLAELAAEVYSIEIIEVLGQRAAVALAEAGYHDVHLRIGDGYAGWPEAAPFDAIIITAAPDHVPQPLVDQLAVGGRLVLPLEDEGGEQVMTIVERREDGIHVLQSLPVRFVPMTGQAEGTGAAPPVGGAQGGQPEGDHE